MNRLANWMMRLYPKRWRARYGDELDALLADTGADVRIVTDLFRGGMRMQAKTWSFLKLALALGVAGALLGTGIGLLLPSQYTSKATLQITPAEISESLLKTSLRNQMNELIQLLEVNVLSRSPLTAIVNDPQLQLYADDRKVKPLEDVIEEMKNNILIDFVALPGALGRRASAFNIQFTYPDRFKAQQTVQALVVAFQSALARRNLLPPSERPNFSLLSVLDQPSLPASPFYPKKEIVMFGGFLFGILIASAWRMVQRTGFIARRFVLVAATLGIACLTVVIVANYLDVFPYQYRSTATLNLPDGASPDQLAALQADVFSRTSLSTVINDRRLLLYKDQLRTTPLEDVIETMKQNLIVRSDGGSYFTVSFDYRDRYKVQQTLQLITNRFFEADRRLYPAAAPQRPPATANLDILDNASLPGSPSRPNRYRQASFGGILGVLTAAVIALIRRRWKPAADFPVDAIHE